MRTKNLDINTDDIIADVHMLLSDLSLSTHRGRFVETERVSIMAQPKETEEAGVFHMPLTIFPTTKPTNWLKNMQLFLQKVPTEGEYPLTLFAYLNSVGEALFSDVPDGTYKPTLLQEREVGKQESSDYPALIHFPLQRLQLRTAAKTYDPAIHQERNHPITRYICQTSSLRIEVKELETLNTHLIFRSKDSCWDYGVLMFHWRDLPQDNADVPSSNVQEYVTVMAWNERFQEYRAEMNVGRVLHGFEIYPPDKPLPPQHLTSDFEDIVRLSLDRAAMKNRERQSWKKLLERERDALPQDMCHIVERML